MDFSQWLQQEMDKNRLTNYRLSKLSGVHQTTIANLLDGAKPQIETEKKIREAILNIGEQKEKPVSNGDEPDKEQLLNMVRNSTDMDFLLSVLNEVNKKLQEKNK